MEAKNAATDILFGTEKYVNQHILQYGTHTRECGLKGVHTIDSGIHLQSAPVRGWL